MPMEVLFSQPYYQTTEPEAAPTGFPQFFPVSIAGRTYMVDTSFEPYRRDAFRHRSIQAQRESIDLNNLPGEGTVNTEGLWRRYARSWHFGAGQPYQDRKGSEDARFSTSKGVNPWMEWQLELLSDTYQLQALAHSGFVNQVGKYLYVLDTTAQTLKFSSNLTTWTTVTGLGSSMNGMATDGYNIWISNENSTDSLYETTAGATSAGLYASGVPTDGVWYVGQRLMVSNGTTIYNLTSGGSFPTPLYIQSVTDWKWTAMCAGSSQIYMAGYSQGEGSPLASTVFRSTIEASGTALTVPVQALPMEGGEYCTSLYGYLNFVFVGSNLGVRMCRTIAAYDPTGNEGDLEAGPLLPGLFPPGPVSYPVDSMVGNNRFMYFGWTNYDDESTGLGRLDLSTFIDTQAPAFTSDLMVNGQGTIASMDWCTINNAPVFVVNTQGVYTATNSPVESGTVTSGYIGYGISDDKIVMAGDIGTIIPQQGTVTMSLASDSSGNNFSLVGTQNSSANGGTPNQSVFPINQVRGELFQVQLNLERDALTSESPIVHRWLIKAIPAVTAGTTISVVIRMWNVQDVHGQDYQQDPYTEYAFLENLRTTQTVFEYQEGPYSAMCVIDEIDWLPEKDQDSIPEAGFQGNIIVYLKSYDIGA